MLYSMPMLGTPLRGLGAEGAAAEALVVWCAERGLRIELQELQRITGAALASRVHASKPPPSPAVAEESPEMHPAGKEEECLGCGVTVGARLGQCPCGFRVGTASAAGGGPELPDTGGRSHQPAGLCGDGEREVVQPAPEAEAPARPTPFREDELVAAGLPTPPVQCHGAPDSGDIVVVLLGQSNIQGRGVVSDGDRQPVERAFVMDSGGNWAPCREPVDVGRGGCGPGRAIASVLLPILAPSARMLLVPSGHGSSRLADWRRGTSLFNTAVSRVRYALASADATGPRAVCTVWHQGESDATVLDDAQSYSARFREFLSDWRSALRDRLPPRTLLPVVLGPLGSFLADFVPTSERFHPRHWRTVNEELAKLDGPLDGVRVVPADPSLRSVGDNVHYDAEAQRRLGTRYGAMLMDELCKSTEDEQLEAELDESEVFDATPRLADRPPALSPPSRRGLAVCRGRASRGGAFGGLPPGLTPPGCRGRSAVIGGAALPTPPPRRVEPASGEGQTAAVCPECGLLSAVSDRCCMVCGATLHVSRQTPHRGRGRGRGGITARSRVKSPPPPPPTRAAPLPVNRPVAEAAPPMSRPSKVPRGRGAGRGRAG
eukprot:TRINITY_DN22023_c0_g1_i1.p1 TRINITY_DN22023_c0_g1~~TRINITY_DN22023_c0_g1_i1.p1  ORF type:complete len:604 (+),score=112.28 TRINITY_DN22023_c0_g1_i1:617-2428(+)